MYYSFAHLHFRLRVTRAMLLGVSDRVCSVEEIVNPGLKPLNIREVDHGSDPD